MPSTWYVFRSDICEAWVPMGRVLIPSFPHPCWRDSSCTSHSVSDPTVDTLTVLPFRSATVLMRLSFSTFKVSSHGAFAMAATPTTGAPLTMKASSGPEPRPTSMLPAASACCNLALPPKSYFSTSIACLLKIPVSMPISPGTKENASDTALPTRPFVPVRADPSNVAQHSMAMTTLSHATNQVANALVRLVIIYTFPQTSGLGRMPAVDMHSVATLSWAFRNAQTEKQASVRLAV